MAGSRTLFMQQPDRRKGPNLPGVRFGVIFRVLKGVFGLADAPRQWYLRLCRTLQEHQECPGRGTVLTVIRRRAGHRDLIGRVPRESPRASGFPSRPP